MVTLSSLDGVNAHPESKALLTVSTIYLHKISFIDFIISAHAAVDQRLITELEFAPDWHRTQFLLAV